MKVRVAIVAALFGANVFLTSAASLAATPPVEINDLVGRWRSDKDKKKIITIVREGNELKLQTPQYSDWEPLKIDATAKATRIRFERKTTADDIRKMKLDNPADGPPPESVVEAAAGSETEAFNGWPKRTTHYFKKECDLTMNVQWQGFHVKWNKDTGTIDDRTRPKPASEDFTQIHYAWPDLRKTVVSTQYTGSSNTGTEINSYFTERPSMEVYGEFGIAIFKPIFSAITDVVPAETLLGKIAQKLFEKTVEKSLQGDLKLRDLAEAVAGQVLGKALEGVADREPFASIRSKLEDVYTEDLVKAAGGSATGKVAEKLTAAEKDALEKYLAEQCRYDLVTLKPYGVILGGISVVDRQTGNATVWLFLKERGSEPRVVIGSTTVPEEGEHKAIGIVFSPIQ
ncbi:MAG TPA: hypothetical protein VFW34_10715 [Candidatus Rubrimentiphilum sp.]|nr:hypothetical protein [Candidatus Rubrimentiphilum sp.]